MAGSIPVVIFIFWHKKFIFSSLELCGCICLLSCSLMSDTLWPHGLRPAKLLCPWDFPGKNTGGGCHFLLHGIFPHRDWTCVSCLSCIGRQILYHCTTWEVLYIAYNDNQNIKEIVVIFFFSHHWLKKNSQMCFWTLQVFFLVIRIMEKGLK